MKEKIIKILQTLDRASSPCPLRYLSLHTNIIEPFKIMEAMEGEGYCRCYKGSDWSPSGSPMFEITPKGKKELRAIEASVLQVPLSILAQALTDS